MVAVPLTFKSIPLQSSRPPIRFPLGYSQNCFESAGAARFRDPLSLVCDFARLKQIPVADSETRLDLRDVANSSLLCLRHLDFDVVPEYFVGINSLVPYLQDYYITRPFQQVDTRFVMNLGSWEAQRQVATVHSGISPHFAAFLAFLVFLLSALNWRQGQMSLHDSIFKSFSFLLGKNNLVPQAGFFMASAIMINLYGLGFKSSELRILRGGGGDADINADELIHAMASGRIEGWMPSEHVSTYFRQKYPKYDKFLRNGGTYRNLHEEASIRLGRVGQYTPGYVLITEIANIVCELEAAVILLPSYIRPNCEYYTLNSVQEYATHLFSFMIFPKNSTYGYDLWKAMNHFSGPNSHLHIMNRGRKPNVDVWTRALTTKDHRPMSLEAFSQILKFLSAGVGLATGALLLEFICYQLNVLAPFILGRISR